MSSLEHVLEVAHTIAADHGLFLEQTWRLQPDICASNSEPFYEGKLTSKESCERQAITSSGPVAGSGLRYLPVPHTGKQSPSIEEAVAVANLFRNILATDPRWNDRNVK